MPRKTKTTAAAHQAVQTPFSAELLEQRIPGPLTPAELEGIFQQFKKSVLERALGAETSHHLGYAPGEAKSAGDTLNQRNGKSVKTVLTEAPQRGSVTNLTKTSTVAPHVEYRTYKNG